MVLQQVSVEDQEYNKNYTANSFQFPSNCLLI